jgi:preprotein translocase subunit SecY
MLALNQRQTDIVGRCVATVLALVAYRVLLAIALPGLTLDHIPASAATLHRLSIISIGPIAWLSAVALGELAVLFLPAAWTRSITDAGHANPFAFPLVILAFAMAAVQGSGIAIALEDVANLVEEPGPLFRTTTIATLVGGTALTIVLARAIQTSGIASGFWVLLAANAAYDFAPGAARLYLSTETGGTLPHDALVQLLILAACMAAVVALVLTRFRMGHRRGEPVTWPILLTGLTTPYIALLIGAALAPIFGNKEWYATFAPDTPIGVLIPMLLLASFTWIFARREGSAPIFAPSFAILAGIWLIAILARHFAPAIGLPASEIVLASAIATMIVIAIRESWAAAGPH